VTASPSKPAAGADQTAKIGVLLVNLGTPEATDYWSMRRYLSEFLSDRRVVETSRLIWWPVLNLIILTTRPSRSGRNYAAVWNDARDEGPLKTVTRAQSEALAALIKAKARDEPIHVDWAMRYGKPSIAARIEALQAEGCTRLLIVPLYPQYAAASTASVCDKVFETLLQMRWQPSLRVLPPYYADTLYIEALARSFEARLAELDFNPEVLLLSFHGVPQAYVEKGDPYLAQCRVTVDFLRQRLGLTEANCKMTFQSRFGAARWLKPYTDATVKSLARAGVKRLAVLTPGFAADCLETLQEIGVETKAIFVKNGGQDYAAIPCLNASETGMEMLYKLVQRELSGWATL
jgi:ferrochelatase